jgi:type II restriction enzyme
MNYQTLIKLINTSANDDGENFIASSNNIQEKIFSLSRESILPLVKEIGTIPEFIPHDSTAEKLYAKTADIVLARCFQLLGLNTTVNRERANTADVTGKSDTYLYSFVADAKVFRLSRTAKNPKDFKVKSMADWRGDHDYSILVCPYYQYPKSRSQIYGQALDENVCLIGWEHFAYLLENKMHETTKRNLAYIWNLSAELSQRTIHAQRNDDGNFIVQGNALIDLFLGLPEGEIEKYIGSQKIGLFERGESEITYWKSIKRGIASYTREKAISELLTTLKIDEKIIQITKFISSL